MNVYKYSEDIVSSDGYGDPQLDDTVDVYRIEDILIYYSERYGDWSMTNHYNIDIVRNMVEIRTTTFHEHGFITAIFKQEE